MLITHCLATYVVGGFERPHPTPGMEWAFAAAGVSAESEQHEGRCRVDGDQRLRCHI